jgi:hypothetical protein
MARRFSRRSLLQTTAAAGLAGCASEEATGTGLGWGIPEGPGEAAAMLPAEHVVDSAFEFFFFGGLNAWDTFYVVPEFGDPNSGFSQPWMYWAFHNGGPDSLPSWFERCGSGNRPMYEPFGTDALGRTVNLGPFLLPFRDRPDLLSRMRMFVVRHEETAHQGAVPLSLCGLPRNSSRLAGTAAHVERFWQEHGDPARVVPNTYVTFPALADLNSLNGDTAASIGLHRASARPVALRLSPQGLVSDQLARLAAGDRRPAIDEAVQHYLQQYQRRLTHGGRTVRAPGFEDFQVARDALGVSDRILSMLSDAALGGATGTACDETSNVDYTGMAMRIARELLLDGQDPARYVCVVDGGLFPADGGGAYDTHVFHVRDQARNATHAFQQLADAINEPGEGDPSKIDLDTTMVLLTTEFGRAPFPGGNGIDHWPYGYVMCVLGGFVNEERAGIVGAIDENGDGDPAITPADFRAAMLMAQGIWPFSEQSFAVGDISEGDTERAAATWLKEVVLGFPST